MTRVSSIPPAAARPGYTLIELMVSMAAAAVLMAGLASCLYIASRAFDGGSKAVQRSKAADVQGDMMIDLNEATAFTARNPDAITFQVPDRNNDSFAESITYAWTGLPAAELTYAENGAPPVTILEDVQDFNLGYLSRFMTGSTPSLPPLDPNQWGERWRTNGIFGYDTIFASQGLEEKKQVATRATMTRTGELQSISCYFSLTAPGGKSDVRLAIYDVDNNDNPKSLLASTAVSEVNATGWITLSTAPVVLNPGEYYLALCIKKTDDVVYHYESGAGETHTLNRDAVKNNFSDPWGNSNSEDTRRVSIYGNYTTN